VSTLRVRWERLDDDLTARLGRITRAGRPSWAGQPDALPWLDRPDAGRQLAGVAEPSDRDLLERWCRDGYVVIDDAIPAADLDRVTAAMEEVWTAARPLAGLTINDVRPAPGEPLRSITHAELLALPAGQRDALRRASRWRIHGFEQTHPALARVYANDRLRRVASLILGRPARPSASITFMYGSEQLLHQDMAVFHCWPRNHLLGAWIACEDVTPGCGPLVFYPGSHVEPMFAEFDRYPTTNLHTADDGRAERYQRWIDGVAERYDRREFLARTGQVLLWHSMLIHGGAPVSDQDATRRSFVVHYAPRHVLRTHDRWDNPRW
jgi:phytanoyl-CoA hydroxylase